MNLKHPWICLVVVACLAGIAGCEGASMVSVPEPTTLKPFASCEQLRTYIEKAALDEMRAKIDENFEAARSRSSNDGPSPGAAPSPGGGSPAGFSGSAASNADGALDTITSDGERIFVLREEQLYAVRSWPPEALEIAGKVQIATREPMLSDRMQIRRRMLLLGDRLVVLSTMSRPNWCRFSCPWDQSTKVTVIDVSDVAAPRKTHQLELPGSFSKVHVVGTAIHMVTHSDVRWPDGIEVFPEDEDARDDPFVYARFKRDNEALIRGRSLEQWLPEALAADAGGECTGYMQPSAVIPPRLTSVVSIDLDDLDDSAAPHRLSLLGAGMLHASSASLYLAGHHSSDHNTDLYKLDIRDARATRLVAWGTIAQEVSSGLADEHEGLLRLATSTWEDSAQRHTMRISIVAEQAGRLVVSGQLEGLAGSHIASARFTGDRAYISTKGASGGLYTVALSDSTSPRLVSELAGDRGSIHGFGDSRLLTLRHKAQVQGTTDVELSVLEIGGGGQLTPGHAKGLGLSSRFVEPPTLFAERGLVAMPWAFREADEGEEEAAPASSPGSGGAGAAPSPPPPPPPLHSELRVLAIAADDGITDHGRLSLADLAPLVPTMPSFGVTWATPVIHRGLIATDANGLDYVYAIADVGVRVARLSDLSAPIKTALFE